MSLSMYTAGLTIIEYVGGSICRYIQYVGVTGMYNNRNVGGHHGEYREIGGGVWNAPSIPPIG
jgi:hypothetical protein